VSRLERRLILQSLEVAGGNKKRAASLLHLKRTTFVEKLKRMGMDSDAAEIEADCVFNADEPTAIPRRTSGIDP